MSNSIAMSTGFLPILSRSSACIALDLLLGLISLFLPSILLLIIQKSPKDILSSSHSQPDMVQHSSNMLAEIKNAENIKLIVKLSTMGVDFEPGGWLNRRVEKMIEDSGIAYTFLRPNAFMQNLR
jgi:hypothetical protein